jgi:uncharacterized LabA/DUF88 family protein
LRYSGVHISLARFKKKTTQASLSRCQFSLAGKRWTLRLSFSKVMVAVKGFEEKKTDVALGVKAMELLHLDACDTLVIVSGDTDFAPAMRTAKRLMRLPDGRILRRPLGW